MAFCLFAPHLDVHLGLKPIPVPDQTGLTPLCVQVALSKWIQHYWLTAACGIRTQLKRHQHHSAYFCLNVKYVGSTFWTQWHFLAKKCSDSQCMHWTLKCNNTLNYYCHQCPWSHKPSENAWIGNINSKNRWRLGLRPKPTGEAYDAILNPLVGWWGHKPPPQTPLPSAPRISRLRLSIP